MSSLVTVVVPAYNEAQTIAKLLESLTQQTTQRPFEVIVVDNASTDTTAATARTFAGRLHLRVIVEPISGRGAARAAGFTAAEGDIVLSTDADTQVPPQWIERLTNILERSQAIAVTGTCRIEDCSPGINRRFNWLQPHLMRAYRLFFGHYWLTGANFAIKKSAYEQAGGFSPIAADLDDIDLGFRVHQAGRIIMVADIPVVTSGRRFTHGLFRGLLPYTNVFYRVFVLKQHSARRD